MEARKSTLLITTVIFIISVFIYTQALADVSRTYYSSGRIESATFDPPDEKGNVYYHFTDENWYYVESEGKWQGRADIEELSDYDEDGALLYKYVFPRSRMLLDLTSGFYEYRSTGLKKVSTGFPVSTTIADINGDGVHDIVLEYEGSGMYKYVEGVLSRISTAQSVATTVADLNGDGKDDLVFEFEGVGMYKYVDGVLSKISTVQSVATTVADLNGDGKDDLVFEYEGAGMYKYENDTLSRISQSQSLETKVADINGDGRDELILEYEGAGTFKYQKGALSSITGEEIVSPGGMELDAVDTLKAIQYGYHDTGYADLRVKGVAEVITTDLFAGGNVYKDTSQKRFGTASAYFGNDGSDDYIGVEDSYKWRFDDTDPWTIDGWVRLESLNDSSSGYMNMIMLGESGDGYFAIGLIESGIILVTPDGEGGEAIHVFSFDGGTLVGPIGIDEWFHVAMVADGAGQLRAYVNGERLWYMGVDGGGVPAEYMPINNVDIGEFILGGTNGLEPESDLHGWIDDFRISDCERWSGEFTTSVPDLEAEIEPGTLFLLDSNGVQGANNFSSTTLDETDLTVWDEEGRIIEYGNVDEDLYVTYEYSESGYLIYKQTETISTRQRRGDWYRDTANNYLWKFNDEGSNTAGIYFEEAGYKLETYWNSDGTVSHWNSSVDYDNGIQRWYVNTAGELELYTWYSHDAGSRVLWKDIYQWNATTEQWDWYDAYQYENNGDVPFGNNPVQVDQGTTGAPPNYITPNKPFIEESGGAALILPEGAPLISSEDKILDDDLKMFFDKVEILKGGSTGEGVLVALLDSGVGDSVINVVGGYDFAGSHRDSPDNDVDYSDVLGHGTKTAEVINATAGDADILALKVMDNYGKTTGSILSDAIRYAVDMGARVLAMPFTIEPVNSLVYDAVNYAVDKGAILITSAGNDGEKVEEGSLASVDNLITVGSVDNDGKLSAWSNCGDEVDLYAPWDVIDNEAGTSFSAAFVAGIAAIMLENDPGMTKEDVLSELKILMEGFNDQENSEEKQNNNKKVEDEVMSKQEILAKSRAQFSGYGIANKNLINVKQ